MSNWDSVRRTKATLNSVHEQTLVRRVGKVCKGMDNRSDLGNLTSIGEHERRVEGLASIVAGAGCEFKAKMLTYCVGIPMPGRSRHVRLMMDSSWSSM
jgi:hypothetical protein